MKKPILSLLVAIGLIGNIQSAVIPSLVAQWNLDGNANDSIGTANGTTTGVSYVTSNFNGFNRTVAHFDGSGGISVNNVSGLRVGTQFTLSAWVNVSSWGNTGGNNGYSIFAAGEPSSWPGNPHEAAYLGSFNSNTVDFNMSSTDQYWSGDIRAGSRYIFSNNSISTSDPDWNQVSSGIELNKWSLLTWVFDGTNSYNYLNGNILNKWQSFNQGSSALSPYNFNYFQIGYNLNGDPNIYQGLLTDLRIYNAALSSTEVSQLYAIPEPSTYALFGIGAIGMLMVMRRKKTA